MERPLLPRREPSTGCDVLGPMVIIMWMVHGAFRRSPRTQLSSTRAGIENQCGMNDEDTSLAGNAGTTLPKLHQSHQGRVDPLSRCSFTRLCPAMMWASSSSCGGTSLVFPQAPPKPLHCFYQRNLRSISKSTAKDVQFSWKLGSSCPCSPWRCVLLIPREKNPGGILQVRVTSECCPRSCYTQAGSPGQADSLLLMTGLFTAILTFDKSTSGALLAAGKLYGGPDLPECEEKSKYGHLKMNGGSCQLHDLGWFKEKCNENVLAPTSCFSCCQEQPPQP
ncbi:hypothetical protein AV530_003480 [Patagioenas fasciata monilis]|uniref:Uncharacterized protein n=1 Tax=Patagioenas fasciata monilis TaxID=372326 RepID=A0A1V4K2W3_PATFA|nr:hypothetical protein AV530_003480 [Patagioenas fasciata monilis]